MTGPLDGCRVLDLGIITAGAATSALLADLGAEVIKVESPGYRDPFRAWLPSDSGPVSDLPSFFRYTNRNKRGVSLDLKSAGGREAFLRLVAESDVVVENFRRGVMDRLGIGYAALRAVRPDIVLASLSSQGETGPEAAYVSYGTTLEAMAGLSWITGYADGAPVASGKDLNYPDQVVAIFAAGMIATALLHRRSTGDGAHLDISQRELVGFLTSEAFLHSASQTRTGNAEDGYVLQDCFAAGDGWVAVSLEARDVAALEAVMPADGRGVEDRLRAWIGARTRSEAVRDLQEVGIAAAPALVGGEVLAGRNHAWHHAIATDAEGRLFKGFPFQWPDAELTIVCDAPHVGADTEQVLREIGGYSQAEIDALARSGAVECRTPNDGP